MEFNKKELNWKEVSSLVLKWKMYYNILKLEVNLWGEVILILDQLIQNKC